MKPRRLLGLAEGFGVGMEMSGHPEALAAMVANMAHGGRVALLGLPADDVPLDLARVVTSMLTLQGVYGREVFETWRAVTVLLEAGLDLRPVITGKYPYQDFGAAASGRGGKVILDRTA